MLTYLIITIERDFNLERMDVVGRVNETGRDRWLNNHLGLMKPPEVGPTRDATTNVWRDKDKCRRLS